MKSLILSIVLFFGFVPFASAQNYGIPRDPNTNKAPHAGYGIQPVPDTQSQDGSYGVGEYEQLQIAINDIAQALEWNEDPATAKVKKAELLKIAQADKETAEFVLTVGEYFHSDAFKKGSFQDRAEAKMETAQTVDAILEAGSLSKLMSQF